MAVHRLWELLAPVNGEKLRKPLNNAMAMRTSSGRSYESTPPNAIPLNKYQSFS
jgi:hypothetical protein